MTYPSQSDRPAKIIVAYCRQNRVIGNKNSLPWKRLPNDLPRFKQTTMGHAVIMGRTTWESLPGLLPGRLNIVLTRNPKVDDDIPGKLHFVSSLDQAISLCDNRVPYVIGGEQIYKLALDADIVGEIIASVVDQTYEGDSFFPFYPGWEVVDSQIDDGYTVCRMIRKKC